MLGFCFYIEGLLTHGRSRNQLATSKDEDASGKALFELALAHALGFGTQSSTDNALDHILRSAKKGYLPAQALFRTWYESC